jgi:hypothetical protein
MSHQNNTVAQNASDLEHFATLLHDLIRKGHHLDAEQVQVLTDACQKLDDMTLELCEAEHEANQNAETDSRLNDWLNADAFQSAYKGMGK